MDAKKGSGSNTTARNNDDLITTIQILDSSRNRLKRACRKDQTYDDKINELLDLEMKR
jgi:autonomous glycyl radical cofactor GrcA